MAQKQGKGKAQWTAQRKARNIDNWVKQQKRKDTRREAQLAREAANRKAGITPWQRLKARKRAA